MVMDRCGPYVMIMRPDSLLRRLSFYPEHGMSPVTQQCTQITSGCICVRRREIKFFSSVLMMNMVDPSGKFVLVSNRYTDSIAVYRIDPLTGYMRNVGFYPCLGKTPRFFCFGDNGKCYVANEDSDTIIEFDFDNMTGALIPTLNIVHTGSPVCILFAD